MLNKSHTNKMLLNGFITIDNPLIYLEKNYKINIKF